MPRARSANTVRAVIDTNVLLAELVEVTVPPFAANLNELGHGG